MELFSWVHPGYKQHPGRGAADRGPQSSSVQMGDITPHLQAWEKGRRKIPQQCLSLLPHALADLPPDEEHLSVQQQPPSSGFAGNSVRQGTARTPDGHLGFLACKTDPGSWDQGTNINILSFSAVKSSYACVCLQTNLWTVYCTKLERGTP